MSLQTDALFLLNISMSICGNKNATAASKLGRAWRRACQSARLGRAKSSGVIARRSSRTESDRLGVSAELV